MSTEILCFENFELDPGAFELRRAGQAVHLERIPLDLLFLLAERRGQLVTRQEIVERIWGKDVFIDSDNSINGAVRKLRRALHDNASESRFIMAIPAKGYRFVALVREAKRASARGTSAKAVRPTQIPFVGRQRELSELHGGLEDAASGHGRLFLISGPPGVGKTRLTAELAALAQAQAGGMRVLAGHCSAQEGAVPYLPFVEILESCVDRSASPESVRSLMGAEGPELARLMPKLRRILPDLAAPLELPAAQARRHLFNCFCDFAARLAGEQPTLLVLDDLHWADDSTLALLDHLVRRLADLPMLVVGIYRDADLDISPGFARALEDLLRGKAISLRLKGLVRDEVALLLENLSGQAPPAAVVGEIYAETGGNPFFVGELFHYLEEENRLYDAAGVFRSELKVAEQEVPQNVRLVVGRRLARLTDLTRKVLATAAAIGRSFPFKVLEAATAADRLLECAEEAERAGLIFSGPQSPEARFEFSHELIRQVVITGQSAARRQRLHLEVAGAIERVYAAELEEHSAELAHHYDHGGNARQAVKYLGTAGVRAAYQLAHFEAIGYWSRALQLLNLLPESPQRDNRELELRQSLWGMFFLTKGNAAPEQVDTNERIAALAQKTGNLTELTNSVFLRGITAFGSGVLPGAAALADQALELALREGSQGSLATAYMLQIVTRYCRGDLAGAEKHFMSGLKFFDDPGVRRGAGVAEPAFFFASLNAWTLGRADVARHRVAQMMAALNESNRYNVACSVCFDARVRLALREYEQAEALAARALELMEKHQFGAMAEAARCVLGLTRAQLGRAAEGIALIRRGLAGFIEVGGRQPIGECRAFLAAALERDGAIIEALETVEQALQTNPDELVTRPEALRIRGELRMIQGQIELAEAGFREAIALAQKIGAKAWELRAATSLARMLARHGRRAEARAMLAEIYGWFTEGFDTADLKDAKALLDELNG